MKIASTRNPAAVSVGLGYFFYYASIGVMLPYFSPALLELGFTKAQAGYLQGASALCVTVVPVIAGRLSDRWFSAERLLRCCALIMLASCLVLWWQTPSAPWVMVGLLIMLAIGRAPIIALQDTLAMEVAEGSPQIYSRLRVMGSLGFIASAVTAGWIFTQGVAQRFFIVLSVIFGVFFAISWLMPHAHRKSSANPVQFWQGLPKAWWLWLLSMALHWFCFGPYHYGLTLFMRELRMPAEMTGAVWSIAVIAEIIVFFWSSRLFQRFSPRVLLLFAMACSLLRWSLLALFPSPWVVGFTQVLHGPGFALFYAACMQTIHRFSGGHHTASYQGLYSTLVTGLGSALGFVAGGALYQRMPFAQVLLVMLIPQTLAMVLLLLNRYSEPRSQASNS